MTCEPCLKTWWQLDLGGKVRQSCRVGKEPVVCYWLLFPLFLHPHIVACRIISSHESEAEKKMKQNIWIIKCLLWFCLPWVSRENVSKSDHVFVVLLETGTIHSGSLRVENVPISLYLKWPCTLEARIAGMLKWCAYSFQIYWPECADHYPMTGRKAKKEQGKTSADLGL